MTGTTVLLDPTSERAPAARERLAPPASLEGRTVALLDISKPRGDVFLDHIEGKLAERGIEVRRYRKPTVSKKAPPAVYDAIVDECQNVVEAIAD
jgi:hypothetical protein